MNPDRVLLARCLHGAVALVVGAALVVRLVLTLLGEADPATGASAAPLDVGTRLARLVSYFTIQSNLIVLVASITLAVAPGRDGRAWRVLRLDSLLAITVTGLVYNVLLAHLVDLDGLARWTDVGLHTVAPLATLVVWVLVGPRPRITWATVAWALVWPVAWIVFTFVRGAVTGWYPYPFMDVTAVGYPTALGATSLVVVLALVLASLFRRLDRRPVR